MGLSRATIGRRLSTVAGFYRFAVIDVAIELSSAEYFRQPKLDTGHPRLDRMELGAFIAQGSFITAALDAGVPLRTSRSPPVTPTPARPPATTGHGTTWTATGTGLAAQILAPFKEIPVDRPIAERAGRIRREPGLRMPDALFAATARERHLGLAARDRSISKLSEVFEFAPSRELLAPDLGGRAGRCRLVSAEVPM